MKRYDFYLPEDLLEAVKARVKDTGNSAAAYMRDAISEKLERKENELPQNGGRSRS